MKSILVVDDEPMLRECLRFALELDGYRVLEAGGGNEAFELLSHESVDLIVSDVRMPGGDGIELLKKVSALAGAAPKVVLMTGFADLNEQRALKLGALAFIQKPFHLETLVKLIQSALA